MALSTISTSSYTPGETTTGDNNDSSIYQLLLDRCRSLEASYANLQEQFHMLEQEQEQTLPSHNVNHHQGKLLHDANDSSSSYNDWISVPDVLPVGFSYKRALDQLGHAVFVSKADTREIIYWNRSAEKLFGYEDYEALGQTFSDLLIYDEFHLSSEKILARVRAGQSWAGQFPFRKRSGVTFMALVNKSPLYEDGELVGIVTVASDATIFNKIKSENSRPVHEEDPSNGQKNRGLNFKKIQWQPPQQLSSFVSNLRPKDILRKGGGNDRHAHDASMDMGRNIQEHENTVEKPPKAPPKRGFGFLWKKATGNDNEEAEVSEPVNYAAKVFSKLNIQRGLNVPQNGPTNISESNNAVNMPNYQQYEAEISHRAHPSIEAKGYGNAHGQALQNVIEDGFSFEGEQNENFEEAKPVDHMAVSTFQYSRREMELEHDLNSEADCEIRWEDLIFKEEIGHGSFARVYRGLWNGSVNPCNPEALLHDVAVKVYFGNQYSEKVLQDYNKEIDIMKRLRHPNVLLYMGSVCTQDKLAMVTELLPRGSLFNVLHNSGYNLDIKRRLRMAADVARGMNYLHHRNPPIVHRDLKSSNLLVDKNWSVKVGDFGLSKLKHATFLTARSGRGTVRIFSSTLFLIKHGTEPQWMAPEVLRNEPSNEKSDVFSFGIILWELVTHSVPWNNMNPLQVVGVVGFMDRRLDLPEDIDPLLSSIIQDCWQSNPTLRPSFENIMLRLPGIMQNLPG
ncbi:PAS domain-containing protein tyrosine kinase family protein [Artemisia annua]|uniref:non-specific serine/threonine protein kinase n=1 Tax=Artemisia annua TaxID=35608 RepID=A0A2U1N2A7_ARTAN|nr:PAS domain-containing protein tyrosine kinase family protein [Artemisia annua]